MPHAIKLYLNTVVLLLLKLFKHGTISQTIYIYLLSFTLALKILMLSEFLIAVGKLFQATASL